MPLRTLASLAVAVAALAILIGCGGGSGDPPPPPPTLDPSCSSFGASPADISQGQSSTLSWSCLNASVSIDNSVGSVAASGSKSVSPASTTTYTLTASGNGQSVTRTAKITVSPPPPPAPTCQLNANPTPINAGASSILSWTTANATSASVDQGIGTVALNGSRSVSPTATTTYTLTVNGAGGSGSCSSTLTVNQPNWTIGGGTFTGTQFSGSVPAADRTYITSLLNQALPIATQILGAPPDTALLSIDVCGGPGAGYNATTHTICIGRLPTGVPPSSQDDWNKDFYFALAASMSLSSHTALGPDWVNYGFSAAGGELLWREFSRAPAFVNNLDLAILNLGGNDIVGGTAGPASRIDPITISASRRTAKEVFLILVATQSIATAGDWQGYTALKDLKALLYARANACQCQLSQPDFLNSLDTFSQSIGGVLPRQWVLSQPISHTQGMDGTYLYVYASPATNPQWLEVMAFRRSAGQEILVTSGTITITIENASGFSTTVSADLAQTHELTFNTTSLAFGAYRIRASGSVGGVSVTAANSYFGKLNPSLVAPGLEVSSLSSVLFLIGRNPDGTVSNHTFAIPSGGASGSFLENENGIAVWRINNNSIPVPEYDFAGQNLDAPLPFSPVYVLNNP